MALVMASMAGLRGSSHVSLEGSLQMSGSTRLNIPTNNRVALTRPGFTVRAQSQQQVPTEPEPEPETSRRAAVLSLVAGGMASGFFVPSVFAASKSIPVGSTPPPSGGLLYSDQQGEMAAATRVIKVAAISGELGTDTNNEGLIRAAIQIAKDSIPEMEIEYVDISKLPLLSIDLIPPRASTYPRPVQDFRKKILRADCFLFSTPEYNYSVTGAMKNAIDWGSMEPDAWVDRPAAILSTGEDFGGGRAQYQLRQMGVRVDLHFINKPEFFVKVYEPPVKFDEDGKLVDEDTRKRLKQMLLSLLAFTQRLQDEC